MYLYWIIIGFLSVCLVLCFGGIIYWRNKHKTLEDECSKKKQVYELEAQEKRKQLEDEYRQTQLEFLYTQKCLDERNDDVTKLKEEIKVLTQEKNELAQCIDYDGRLEELKSLLSANVSEIDKSQARLVELNSLIDTKNGELTSMERRIIENEASAQKLKKEIEGLENYEKVLQDDLVALQTTHRNALMVVDGDESSTSFVTFTFASLTANERRICELVNEIVVNYPELSLELGKIVWSKVWMPKIQSIVKREDFIKVSHHTIYKLTLISDPNVCYVGQAVDLKERWYTHIKKMVGAEVKGGEKLYNRGYTPSDFTWSVLEWDLGKGVLDERERYWIDFFGGVELGLNSK